MRCETTEADACDSPAEWLITFKRRGRPTRWLCDLHFEFFKVGGTYWRIADVTHRKIDRGQGQ